MEDELVSVDAARAWANDGRESPLRMLFKDMDAEISRLQQLIKEKDEALEKAEQAARMAVFSATNNALDEDEQGRAIYDHAAKIAGIIADEIADLRRAREAKDRK